jgi:hypothetical protein
MGQFQVVYCTFWNLALQKSATITYIFVQASVDLLAANRMKHSLQLGSKKMKACIFEQNIGTQAQPQGHVVDVHSILASLTQIKKNHMQ